MSQNSSDSAAPPAAASRKARPVSAPSPIAISARAISSPIGIANGSIGRMSGASGDTRVNAASWATMEAGFAASKKAGSTSLSIPA